jgi:hypothetical protein
MAQLLGEPSRPGLPHSIGLRPASRPTSEQAWPTKALDGAGVRQCMHGGGMVRPAASLRWPLQEFIFTARLTEVWCRHRTWRMWRRCSSLSWRWEGQTSPVRGGTWVMAVGGEVWAELWVNLHDRGEVRSTPPQKGGGGKASVR